MSRGKYIVIEGPDSIGKTNQITLLAEKLKSAGLPIKIIKESENQNSISAKAISSIINNPNYPMNNRTEVLLYNAARSQSLELIRKSVANGIYCICDQNYLTTLAIQYYGQNNTSDYNVINQIIDFAVAGVEPDLTVVMDAAVNIMIENHEIQSSNNSNNVSEEYLEKVRAGYLWEANQRSYPIVFSTPDIETAANDIWNLVTPVIARRELSNILAVEPASIKEIISEKLSTLEATNVVDILDEIEPDEQIGSVTLLSDKISPITRSAAMARLSRLGEDFRTHIFNDKSGNIDKDEKLLQGLINTLGDNSIKESASQHIIIENASHMLVKLIEANRFTTYYEQPVKYINYSAKDDLDHYKFYVPKNLNSNIKKTYTSKINEIFKIYSEMFQELTNYMKINTMVPKSKQNQELQDVINNNVRMLLSSVLPISCKTIVGIYGSTQAIESIITNLKSSTLIEANNCGDEILAKVRKSTPAFYEHLNLTKKSEAEIEYRVSNDQNINELAEIYLKDSYGVTGEPVILTDYFPKNELDLIPDMLYENSSLPYNDIKVETNEWSYKKKSEIFNAYMGDRVNLQLIPGRAIEKAHYSLDIVCDFSVFKELQRHRIVENLNIQELTPRYGYETPDLIDEAGLTDKYQECFSISLELFSILQGAGYNEEAQYATLLGHKLRWQLTYNAREAFHIHELHTNPQSNPETRKLVQKIHEKLLEVHPLIGGAMKFVNLEDIPTQPTRIY